MHILYLSIRQEVPDNNNRTTLSVVGRLQPHSKQEMQHFCGKAYHGLGSDLMYLYLHRVGILTCNKVCHFIFACDCGILVCARARHSYVAVIWLFSSSELFFAVIRIFFNLFSLKIMYTHATLVLQAKWDCTCCTRGYRECYLGTRSHPSMYIYI